MFPFQIDAKICFSSTVDTRGADDVSLRQILRRVQDIFIGRRGETQQ
jgi:hypothetical protein